MLSAQETDDLAKIAVLVCEDWQLIEPDESIVGDRVNGALEHLIHEMAHAASLGIEWNKDASRGIGDALSEVDQFGRSRQTPLAIAEETRTWAIEWNVWKLFDLPFEWGDLRNAASIQDCNSEEIESMIGHQYIQDMADDVFQQIIDFLRDFERDNNMLGHDDIPKTTSVARLELRPLDDMQPDGYGGFMQRVLLCPEAEAYLHLLPIQSGADGQPPVASLSDKNPHWNDFMRITEGMDGPLQTIEGHGQEFLFFLVPCMM